MVKIKDKELNQVQSAEDAPECLVKIVDYLNTLDIKVTKSKDGRVGSIKDEDLIVESLCKSDDFVVVEGNDDDGTYCEKIKCIIPEIREWYDLVVVDGLKRYYVNIKSSTLKGYDNIGSLPIVIYGLFGKKIDTNSKRKQYACLFEEANKYHKKGYDEIKDMNYYFLVINKNVTNNIFITSFNHMNKDSIKPNGCNPPFQCNWSKNSTRVKLTKGEICELVVSVVWNSLVKSLDIFKIDPLDEYRKRTGMDLNIPLEVLWRD